MTLAAGSRHGLSYVPEVTWGTTPSTPTMVSLRHTGCNLGVAKDTFQSNELRNDRMIVDVRHGAVQVLGDINFELSYGEYDPLLEAALFGTWSTNVLKAGTTEKYFTLEREFSDITKYSVFTGCMVNTMSLSIPSNNIVTGTFTMMGKDAGAMSGTPLDPSPTASQTNDPFDSFTGSISEGGGAIAIVTSLDLTLENGLDPAYVIASNTCADIVPMRSNLTGTLSAYFESETLYNKFINETESSLSFTLGSGAGTSYTFDVPALKYTGGGQIETTGEGLIALSMPFQAVYDSGEATSFKITRIP